RLPIDPPFAQQCGFLRAIVEFIRIGIELEDAARLMSVVDAGCSAQRTEAIARIERKIEALDRVAPRSPRQAFAEKGERESPLVGIGTQAEEQRRVLASQPFEDFPRGARVRPRPGMRSRYLAAVRERSLARRPGLAIHNGDLVPLLREIPRSGDANHPRAEHQD